MKSALVILPLILTACMVEEAPKRTSPSMADRQVDCIDLDLATARRPEPPQSIIVEIGGKTYRNEIVGSCPGLERATAASVLTFESFGGRLCSGDSVRVYDPVEARAGGVQSITECRLGKFQLVAVN